MITSTALVLLMIPGVGYVHAINVGVDQCFQLANIWLQILLFWPRPEEVCLVSNLALHHGDRRHLLPMVLLGLLVGVQRDGEQVYRGFECVILPSLSRHGPNGFFQNTSA